LTDNYHKLGWDCGDVDYEELEPLLVRYTRNIPIVFTKGREKAAYLEKILSRHVVDLESMGCPALPRLPRIDAECLAKEHKNSDSQCALRNAIRLSTWCSDNRDVTDLSTSKARLLTYSNFSVPYINPSDLADVGFYSTREGDRVQCAYCPTGIKYWQSVDVPAHVHKRSSPTCPLLHEFNSGTDECGWV
jgi:Inhibitor of Apoptosis domain